MTVKKALKWVAFWVGLALSFNVGIYFILGQQKALEFLGGYIIEQSLSVDNLFLFLMIFTSFGIKSECQRKVLNYGIAGAIILRLLFIILGISIINMFHWVLYIFGVILIISGVRMVFKQDDAKDFKDKKLIRILGKLIPITEDLVGTKFFVTRNAAVCATPLFAIVILVEFTDIIFAIDSIPAIFSITTDPFIVYTSNIFAILGLRSMYFVLGRLHERFRYVKFGVAMILVFTGIKLSILVFHIEIPIGMSLGIIVAILAASISISSIAGRRAHT